MRRRRPGPDQSKQSRLTGSSTSAGSVLSLVSTPAASTTPSSPASQRRGRRANSICRYRDGGHDERDQRLVDPDPVVDDVEGEHHAQPRGDPADRGPQDRSREQADDADGQQAREHRDEAHGGQRREARAPPTRPPATSSAVPGRTPGPRTRPCGTGPPAPRGPRRAPRRRSRGSGRRTTGAWRGRSRPAPPAAAGGPRPGELPASRPRLGPQATDGPRGSRVARSGLVLARDQSGPDRDDENAGQADVAAGSHLGHVRRGTLDEQPIDQERRDEHARARGRPRDAPAQPVRA